MDFLRTPQPGRRWAPGATSTLGPHAAPDTRAVGARRCCRLGFLAPPSLPLLILPVLVLSSPPSGQVGQVSGIAWGPSDLCRCTSCSGRPAGNGPAGDPSPAHSPVSTHHPTHPPVLAAPPVSSFGISCLHNHPSFFISSTLSFNKKTRSAEDAPGCLREIALTYRLGCRGFQAGWTACFDLSPSPLPCRPRRAVTALHGDQSLKCSDHT